MRSRALDLSSEVLKRPRGICQGPHYVNADLGLYKNWHVKEKVNIRFSMDFFNAFNHTNFDANGIQGVGNQAGFFYDGSGVYCGANSALRIAPFTSPAARPITLSARSVAPSVPVPPEATMPTGQRRRLSSQLANSSMD